MKKQTQHTAPRETRFRVNEEMELMPFLLLKMGGMSRNSVKSLLAHRQVSVNGEVTTKFDTKLKLKDQVAISNKRGNIELSHPKLSILFEDAYIIVVEKKNGLLTVSTRPDSDETTAFSILKNHVKKANTQNRIYVVHRLDRETSGILVFAKSRDIQLTLQENWHRAVRKRTYVALVEGKMEKSEDTIVSWLTENQKSLKIHSSNVDNGGQQAVTHFKVIKSNDDFSLLEVNLETGRKNQIRVHMQDIGHPIVNDKKYGAATNPIGRMGLHARILDFYHPVSGEVIHFETPVPRDFLRVFHVQKNEE